MAEPTLLFVRNTLGNFCLSHGTDYLDEHWNRIQDMINSLGHSMKKLLVDIDVHDILHNSMNFV